MLVKMTKLIFMLLGVIVFLCTSCFPIGDKLESEKVIGIKKVWDEEDEQIISQKWHEYWWFFIGHDGFFRITYFYDYRYIWRKGQQEKKLSFITKPINMKYTIEMQYAVPVLGTNNWISSYYTDMTGETITLDFLVFTPEKLIARPILKNVIRSGRKYNDNFSGYGVGLFSDDNHSLTMITKNGEYTLDCISGKIKQSKE